MKKALKVIGSIALILVALIVILYIGFRIYILINSDDESLRDDSHLIPKIEKISDEENAWFELKKAEEVMYYPEDEKKLIRKMISGEEWNKELAEKIIEKNQEAYGYIEASANKEYFASPSFQKLNIESYNIETVLENISFIRKLNEVYLISIKDNLLRGGKGATDKIFISLDLSNKVKSMPSGTSMTEYLTGLATAETTYSFIETVFLEDWDIYKSNSIAFQEELEKSKKNKDGLANYLKFGYIFIRNSAINLGSKEYLMKNIPEYIEYTNSYSKMSFYFKVNKFKNMIANNYEREIANSYRSCDNLIPYKKQINGSYLDGKTFFLTENAIGKIIVDIFFEPSDSIQERRCIEDFRVLALQFQLASNAYKLDKGKYPETIEELNESEYLATEMPENIHGWEINYDKYTGKLVFPEEVK